MLHVGLLCLFWFCDIYINTRHTGFNGTCSGQKASCQFLPLSTCQPAVFAWVRGTKAAVLHVESVRCLDNTKRTTNGRRGKVNLVDTCLQHHLGPLWQNTYQVITSCLNLSERLHIDKSCLCSTGVMVTLITANKMCCKVSAPLRAWQVYVCQVSSTWVGYNIITQRYSLFFAIMLRHIVNVTL